MIKRLILMLISAFCVVSLGAQNFTKYNFGESEIIRFNPAAAIEDGNQAYAAYKHNWCNSTGYKENPNDVDAGVTVVSPWGAISGEIDYDGYSFYYRHELKLNYSYVWKLKGNDNSRLSVGGGISFGIDRVNFDKLGYPTILAGQSTYCSPDFNLGIEYNNDHMRTGIGGINLVAAGLKFDTTKEGQNPPKTTSSGAQLLRNPRVIMAYFLYRFDVAMTGFTPIVEVGYSERTEVMLGLRFDYNKIVDFSYCFRAMEMAHLCNLNFTIPKSHLSFNVSYSKCAFYKDQTLACALRVHW